MASKSNIEVLAITRDLNIPLGIGVIPGKNKLPIPPYETHSLTLRRYTLDGRDDLNPQLLLSRSEFSTFGALKALLQMY